MTTHPKSFSLGQLHTEQVVERHLVQELVAKQGYVERRPCDFYRKLALDRDMVLEFVKKTQPDAWKSLEENYPDGAKACFFKNLENNLKRKGTLDVIRDGFKIVPNIEFHMCYFRPASSINHDLVRLWESNTLSVMTQVAYSMRCGNTLDVVLFVNGLPIATLEVKNTLTDQTFRHAEAQYCKDRSPAGEPLLTFKRGALVHFALDQENVSMTTRLLNGKTQFLPFNRGRDGGAGNPDIEDDFPIGYLYADQPGGGKAIFGREVWLNLLDKFIHLEKRDGKKRVLFPRFHQLDCVRKILAHACVEGSGQNYLIQHSAGSGKSNTIAWLSHQIINLHDETDKAIFDVAIIVTDRLVLDRQLQETVASFEKTPGVVKKIDGTSRDLKKAIEQGKRIIITTIWKFGTEHLAQLSGQGGKSFAVIIDEAHSSQSGKTSANMVHALTRSSEDVEDVILEYQRARGPQPNISFLAFTATPRNVTLQRFGGGDQDKARKAFHLYSMRQAIHEGFILDVLQNYMTYRTYYQLEKAIREDPRFRTQEGQQKVAQYARLHPTTIAQQAEVIIEHFRKHATLELKGDARAMVVTDGREHALRYWQGLKKYIQDQGYTDLRTLIAFSGTLKVDGVEWTERSANEFSESELPLRFDGTREDGTSYDIQYQVLVVADKYQTGFDQPKLCAMYVDKKLDGLRAVQTLSRLNRTHPKKKTTFVLDFQNSMEDIQEAFKPYFEATCLEELSDSNQIYSLRDQVMGTREIDCNEIEDFAGLFFGAKTYGSDDRVKMESIVREACQRFASADDEVALVEFRQLAKSYMRFYAFVAQIARLDDTELEKLYVYLDWLIKLLPSRETPPQFEITDDMLNLEAYRVEKEGEESGTLENGDSPPLPPIDEFGANSYTEEEESSLSEIIEAFNERHGTNFTREDFIRLEQVNQEVLNSDMRQMILNNSPDVVREEFSNAFMHGLANLFQRENEMKSVLMSDEKSRGEAIGHFFKTALRQVREGAEGRLA